MDVLISSKDLQVYLKTEGFLESEEPFIAKGDNSMPIYRAVWDFVMDLYQHSIIVNGEHPVDWSRRRRIIAVTQYLWKEIGLYSDEIDGLIGPNTEYALERWQNYLRSSYIPGAEEPAPGREHGVGEPDPLIVSEGMLADLRNFRKTWPRYKPQDMAAFYGEPGTGLETVTLPYPMRLAWDTDHVITRTVVHRKCKDSFVAVLEMTKDFYTLDGIRDLRLDLFGGVYNKRKVRGGSIWSTHAWACAIDLDPERNRLRWGAEKSVFSRDEYKPFWQLWEAAGWVSLGRERNYDWMHIQAAAL